MSSKKRAKIKNTSLKNIQSLIPKNFSIEKIKINPLGVIEKTKNKIGNFYSNIQIMAYPELSRRLYLVF